MLTGTQLVRVKDGGRIGLKACWAMLIRTLFMPLLLLVVIAGAFEGTGGQGRQGRRQGPASTVPPPGACMRPESGDRPVRS
ncbi:hypothetical protein ACFQY4_19315 [Catellatospora bangladeshensis]|uniref:hypothetical protein n=1 Tax=Catellatospora bangladeshensis TaxID=310355 RepID=UPI00360A95FE